jgi:hypothetical protein
MISVIIGIVFIVGGLTGNLTLIGTNSGAALAIVGVFLLGRGVYRLRRQRAQHPAL